MRNWRKDNIAGWSIHLLELIDMTDTHVIFLDVNTGSEYHYPYHISKTLSDWSVDHGFRYYPPTNYKPEHIRSVYYGERQLGLILRGFRLEGDLLYKDIWDGDYKQILEHRGRRLTLIKNWDKPDIFLSGESFQELIDVRRVTREDVMHHFVGVSGLALKLKFRCCQKYELTRRSLMK